MLVRGHPTESVPTAPHRKTSLGWATVPVMHAGTFEMHCLPVDDSAPHQLAGTCLCGAREDPAVDGVFLHNAWDRRETYASGRRKVH